MSKPYAVWYITPFVGLGLSFFPFVLPGFHPGLVKNAADKHCVVCWVATRTEANADPPVSTDAIPTDAIPKDRKSADKDLPKRVESQNLANLIQVHPEVLSGGLPHGDAAFEELAKLGVRTVISVDGAKPDTVAAKKHGLRYVHLPHGYDGISSQRALELAKAVLELEGPIYIHCHHGKHRSPTASGVACATAGLIPESQVLSILELAGTDPHYQGLYRVAKQAKRMKDTELAAIKVDYKEIAEVTPLAEAMVELEETFDSLKRIEKSGWKVPKERSFLQPAPQALLLVEHFVEMLRSPQSEKQTEEYLSYLTASMDASKSIYDALKDLKQSRVDFQVAPELASVLGQQLKTVGDNCRACHHEYRDQ